MPQDDERDIKSMSGKVLWSDENKTEVLALMQNTMCGRNLTLHTTLCTLSLLFNMVMTSYYADAENLWQELKICVHV